MPSEGRFEIPHYVKFISSAISGVAATLVCYPLEKLKNHLQLYGKLNKGRITALMDLKDIIKRHGITGVYEGCGASVARQTLYTGTRMGLYQIWSDYVTHHYGPPNLATKCKLSVVAGALGGIAGLPADVVLSRISTDDLLPLDKRRNYKNARDAVIRMVREEGVSTLFLGFTPVVIRAIILNTTQILGYYHIQHLVDAAELMHDKYTAHVFCSMVSALLTTYIVLPIDLVKTRIQSMHVINGRPEYRGVFHVLRKVVAKEGPLALWSGFGPLITRNGPQFLVIFLVYEKCIELYQCLNKSPIQKVERK